MRTVTKAQVAKILQISPKEVVRRIESGELKAHKKTASKYSDWLIELPDKQEETKAAEEVKSVLSDPETSVTETPDEQETKEESEIKEEPEPVVELPKTEEIEPNERIEEVGGVKIKIIKEKKEDKLDGSEQGRAKKGNRWWFGN